MLESIKEEEEPTPKPETRKQEILHLLPKYRSPQDGVQAPIDAPRIF